VDRLTRAQRSAVMSRIRSRETAPERLLRSELGRLGLRGWRKNARVLAGVSSPDVAFTRWRVAVFVDGCFWHGHPDHFTYGKSGAYWDAKITRNRERDATTTAALKRAGWRVIRAWDFDVERDAARVALRVAGAVAARRRRAA
jgi:DNA mismatch endonuclease (patch repair protein)